MGEINLEGVKFGRELKKLVIWDFYKDNKMKEIKKNRYMGFFAGVGIATMYIYIEFLPTPRTF